MTEKEFLSRAYGDDRLSLLDLAKEAGAKFDPEPRAWDECRPECGCTKESSPMMIKAELEGIR